jgi:hypothetical protein
MSTFRLSCDLVDSELEDAGTLELFFWKLLVVRKKSTCCILNAHSWKMVRFSSQADCPISKRKLACGNISFDAEESSCDKHWGFQLPAGAREQWNDIGGDPQMMPGRPLFPAC